MVKTRRSILRLMGSAAAAIALPAKAQSVLRLSWGNTPFLGSAPLYLALDRGWFSERKIEVALIENTAGWQSLKGVQEGQLDLGLTAELPVAYALLNPQKYTKQPTQPFVILADTISSRAVASGGVGRRDRGIAGPTDLRGKRVAVPMGTTLDLYLDLLLSAHGLNATEIQVVDMPENHHLEALRSGAVDAAFSFRQTVVRAQRELGANAVMLTSPVNFTTNWLLVANRRLAAEHPQRLTEVLRVLDRAGTACHQEPEAGRDVLVRRAGMNKEAVHAIWGEHQYRIALHEAVARNLETEMRWILRREGRAGARVPDLTTYVDAAPLRAMGSDRVTLQL